jgi:drug/metabolite transporter (DMT)-like permease
MILGFAVWGDVPTPGLLVGSAIVVASGAYILWRETVRAAALRRSRRRSMGSAS